ncbi:MAG: SRPBCC family protein [Saprospiraceae bacterium]|nr:SRPBCC family protein [Saprospiraceae bacterium]
MNVDVLTSIDIQCPLEAVAAYAADPNNAPVWYENIKTVEWITNPPLQIGSQVAFVAHFLGKRMAYTYQIEDWIPGERLVMKTTEGPFPMETTYMWSDAGNGHTRMSLRNQGQPKGFSAWIAPMMSWAMGRANRKDLLAIKRILEAGE